ncbi:DUF3325 domain-containing protein [Luteimonas sp. SDU82]|uniref:DUF3325 domain-containing protein n=1 Tax=Luteimonas sp. SDU82 TaxID=3422592 RepID=UPI003EBBB6A3
MPESLLLMAATFAAFAAMGWLALTLPAHAVQVWGRPLPAGHARSLRVAGAIGIVASLALCLLADHASMAVLVWLMTLSGSALLVAMLLSSRPRWLRVLAPGLGRVAAR